MEAKGWIKAEWGRSDKGRKAKLYSLTRTGRRQLDNERELWSRMAVAIGSVLKNA
jgi:DNA-binding PadR family transcriptional regulator